MKSLSLLLLFIGFFVTACGATYEVAVSETPVACPLWTELEGSCEIKFRKFDIYPQGEYESSRMEEIDFEEYLVLRMSFFDGEILIDNAENILVTSEAGDLIEHKSIRLVAGTYYVFKQNTTQPATFEAHAHGQSKMTVQLEFAGRPAPREEG